MGQFLMFIGGGLIINALVSSIAMYLNDRERRNGKGRSVVLFATGILFSGVLAICFFIYAAAPALCSMFPGEECGWVAAIIGVPGFFALGAATFVYFWVRRGNTLTLRSSGTAQKRAAP
jgi:uncharacterized membrane protein